MTAAVAIVGSNVHEQKRFIFHLSFAIDMKPFFDLFQ